MSNELVPFGKQKGQPVEVMLADPGYREWLLAQPWLRDRYPTFHQTIINYGGEPAETPEHNQLQASLLDDQRCLALATLLYPPAVFDGGEANREFAPVEMNRYRHRYSRGVPLNDLLQTLGQNVTRVSEPARVYGRKFEADGWDVLYTLRPTSLWLELRSLPGCLCACDHERDCPASSSCREGDGEHRCNHRHYGERTPPTFEWWQNATEDEIEDWLGRHHSSAHCDPRCVWRDYATTKWLLDDEERLYLPDARTVRVECKPDLGDDFPAVLRQVTRYDSGEPRDRRCVVVRRHAFEHVSWEQVTEMFRASGITLIREQQLAEAQLAGEAPTGRSTT